MASHALHVIATISCRAYAIRPYSNTRPTWFTNSIPPNVAHINHFAYNDAHETLAMGSGECDMPVQANFAVMLAKKCVLCYIFSKNYYIFVKGKNLE